MQELRVESLNKGILTDEDTPASGFVDAMQGMDYLTEPGWISPAPGFVNLDEAAATNNVTTLPTGYATYTGNATYSAYALGDYKNVNAKRLYGYHVVNANWTLIKSFTADAARETDLLEFNGKLYWAVGNGKLGESDGTTWNEAFQSFTTSTIVYAPMVKFAGKLFIGNGRYVSSLATDGTWTAEALTLPVGSTVRTMRVWNDQICIGADYKLYTWDGASAAYSQAFTVGGTTGAVDTIYAMGELENTLMLIVYGAKSLKIYTFNGASLEAIKATKLVNSTSPGRVGNQSVQTFDNILRFANDTCGIWCLGRTTSEEPFALTLRHTISNNSGMAIGFYVNGVISYTDGTDYFIAELGSATDWEATRNLDTIVHDCGTDNLKKLYGFKLNAKSIDTSNSFTISYKVDHASSWTACDYTIDSTNYERILYIPNVNFQRIQFRITPTATGSTVPKFRGYTIYYQNLNNSFAII